MEGQITIFDLDKEPEWAKEIANGLKEHCNKWGFDCIEKFQSNKTAERFYKIFCWITKTYYIEIGEDFYNITFSKDGNVSIKRTGPDWSKRNEDAIISIEEVIAEL